MRLIDARREEVAAVASGFLLFFLLFASYFMLRPVRETFGIVGGIKNLQWMFTGTFLATLAVIPIYGALAARVPRRRLLPAAYIFSAVVMAGFAISLLADPTNVWIARAFYIWISVFNLFVVSLAWSLMVDVFSEDQSRRLFGQVAAGASLGGLAGPLLSTFLVAPIGHAGLLFVSTALLLSTLLCVRHLLRWSDRNVEVVATHPPADRSLHGSIWAGITLIARSRYLLAISAFVILLTTATTFLYFEQARLVAIAYPDRVQQTQVFGTIDSVVQALAILIQIFFTGAIAKRLGVTVLLTVVPFVVMFGFGLLAVAGSFPVLVAVMIVRRVGEYGLIRPGREMLFTSVDTETKYKAKNAVDTFVYRAGDAVSAWANTGIVAIGSTGSAAVAGVVVAALWTGVGLYVGRHHDRAAQAAEQT